MRPRVLLRPLVAIAVFAACAWLVRRQLAAVDAERVRQAIALVPARRLVMAALATAGSFGALAAMEHTLFAAIAAPVRWRRVLPTAFIAGTVSASVGLVLVSSALVRLRLYRRWQVPAGDVLRVSLAFAPVVVASGLLAAGLAIAAGFDEACRALGAGAPAVALLACASMLPAAALVAPAGGRTWGRGRRRVVVPTRGHRLALLAAGLADWGCAGVAALAVSGLPASAGPLFLLQFVFGWLFGAASGLPGGAGAIDATMLATFHGRADLAMLVAGLLLFRLVYFVVPTFAALALWALVEWRGTSIPTTTEEQA